MKTKEKIIEQVQKFMEERSQKALEVAKKEVLKEKMECKEIIDAFMYYVKNWNDVIHPGLISIACEAVGEDVDKSVPIQVVMLLLTAAVDVHDDIIDESKTKYGKPTVLARFGKDITLLVGDAFLMKAVTLLHKLEKEFPTEKMNRIWNIINSRFFELGDAEALEASLKGNMKVSPEECLHILEKKASSFEAHTRIGAVIGGGEPNIIDILSSYGKTLGILMGIREDFIDIFEPDELQNRVKNECLPLPLLCAFKNPQTKKTLLNLLSKPAISNKDAERIVDIIFEDRTVKILKSKIQSLAEKALKSISLLHNEDIKYELRMLMLGTLEDL